MCSVVRQTSQSSVRLMGADQRWRTLKHWRMEREWKREITKQSDECERGVEVRVTWMGRMRDERMV